MRFVDDANECNLILGCIILQSPVDICSFDIVVVCSACSGGVGAIARSFKLVFSQKRACATALSLSTSPFGYGHL